MVQVKVAGIMVSEEAGEVGIKNHGAVGFVAEATAEGANFELQHI